MIPFEPVYGPPAPPPVARKRRWIWRSMMLVLALGLVAGATLFLLSSRHDLKSARKDREIARSQLHYAKEDLDDARSKADSALDDLREQQAKSRDELQVVGVAVSSMDTIIQHELQAVDALQAIVRAFQADDVSAYNRAIATYNADLATLRKDVEALRNALGALGVSDGGLTV